MLRLKLIHVNKRGPARRHAAALLPMGPEELSVKFE